MGKNVDLSPRKRGQIRVLLANSSMTQTEIAKMLNVSQTVVSRTKKILKIECDDASKRIGHCGRKRISTPREDRLLLTLSRKSRKKSSGQLQIALRAAGVDLSKRTIRRRLVEGGFKAYRPRKKPKLTPVMRKARLQWAKNFANWNVDDWKRVSCIFFH